LKSHGIRIRATYLAILCFFCGYIPSGGTDSISLPIEYGRLKHLRGIAFYTQAASNKDAEEISRIFSTPSLAEKMTRVEQDQIIISHSAYWAKIELHNPTDYQQSVTVFLNNPMLDSMQFFRDDGLGMYEAGIAGSLLEASRWSNTDRLPSIPLLIKPKSKLMLLIRIRNTFSSRMAAPLYIASTATYNKFQLKESAFWALKIGILLCLGLSALILAIIVGKSLYVWPFLLACTLTLLTIVKSGYAREMGWLLGAGIANHMAWVLTVILNVLYIRLGMAFLRTSRSAPLIDRWLNGLSLGFAISIPVYALLWLYLMEWRHSIIPIMMILQLPGLFLLIWSCYFAFKWTKYRSITFFAATMSIVTGGILDAFGSIFWLEAIDKFGFSVLPGAFLALIFIICTIFYEISLQRIRRKQLAELVQRKRQDVARSFVMGQEAERRRIGQELHDHLAAQLLNARMMMPSYKEDQSEWQSKEWESYRRGLISLDLGLNEVRTLSYQLDPHPMNASRLKDELGRMLKNLNIARPSCAFHLDFEIENTELHPAAALDLYRVCQECLSNIVKHSAASSVYVELTRTDQRIQLCVIDNGVGFDLAISKMGIGLKSIKNRLSRMKNHSVRIESSPGCGTSVFVSFDYESAEDAP
jgi:signal transduction histidine kinase